MSTALHELLHSIEATDRGLESAGYIANRPISTAVYLAHHLRKPILVEGSAGVGKTELARPSPPGSACR